MIPVDPRDTLRIGFKSGASIEVKVEDAPALIKSLDLMWKTANHERQVIGGALVVLDQVECMQVVPKAYPQEQPYEYRPNRPDGFATARRESELTN